MIVFKQGDKKWLHWVLTFDLWKNARHCTRINCQKKGVFGLPRLYCRKLLHEFVERSGVKQIEAEQMANKLNGLWAICMQNVKNAELSISTLKGC